MYAIRVRVDEARVEVTASGPVGPEEALRAVAQAFALAEAGEIARATCDLTGVEGGSSGIIVLGAAFASRFQPTQLLAVICSPRQLALCRRLARLSALRDNVGIFTRESDAVAWLLAPRGARALSVTARRHFAAAGPAVVEVTPPASARAAS